MDDLVIAALKKWPHVPHVRGWLGLDARGRWYLRDERVQAAGSFATVRGSPIEHAKLVQFIGRNYEADEAGCWFFQNGPQRVYVQLEAAPWVWRLQQQDGSGVAVTSHSGRDAQADGGWLDEQGRLFLASDIGLGLVHTQDMGIAAQAVESGLWRPQDVRFDELPRRFGYRLDPAASR